METGWLIEGRTNMNNVPIWFAGESCWTTDSLRAIRFARKVDAEKMMSFFRDSTSVATEHQWG